MSFARFLFVAAACTTLAPLGAFAETPTPPAAAPVAAAPTAGAPATTAGSFTPPAASQEKSSTSSANAPVTRAEIPDLVKQAILDNPEIVMQAAQKLRDKQLAEGEKQAKEALTKHKADLLNDTSSPSVGDAKTANVTVVEFFDYHCGYCKHMVPAITQLLKNDKKVRVVFKEFPILSEDSMVAARAGLAAYHVAPDKYFDYYTELMQSNGKFDETSLLAAAKKVGIDPDKLKTEMAKPEISAELDKNRTVGEDLGIHGTPALVVGNQLIGGALPYEDLQKAVDEARSGKKSDAEAPKS